MAAQEHYFTARPASADQRSTRTVRLAGRAVDVEIAPGIFSPEGIDKGTRVLLDAVPDPPAGGTFLDLGCGWGPIALTLAMLAPQASIHAVDVNERCLDLTARNAQRLGLTGVQVMAPEVVPQDAAYDLIWSNPPIRIGKAALHDLLRAWLTRLTPDGTAYLVVSKNLGADSLHRWVGQELSLRCDRFASSRGFRVLRISR